MRKVIVLGSTGSIGTQTLDVVRRNAERYVVHALAAGGSNLELLVQQIEEFQPALVAVADESKYRELSEVVDSSTELRFGSEAVSDIAACGDNDTVVVNGITGGIGLEPTLAALASGATLALANKESLIVGGPLTRTAMVRNGQIVPVDSEHSAIAQCLTSGLHRRGLTVPIVDGTSEVDALIVTASGGPFRGRTRAELTNVTVAQALAHPTWNMGPVVTINSSTLVNKALEVAEAHLLFDIEPDRIETVVHPQSIIHSFVRFCDGSTIAQASPPSMLIPIALGLSWPERLEKISSSCDFSQAQSWTFEPVDNEVFPAINLMRDCLKSSPAHPAVFNAANETCVNAFRQGRLNYIGIVDTVAEVCASFTGATLTSVTEVADIVQWASVRAEEFISRSK